MTEEQIEREVERRFDLLDARLMRDAMSQAEYDNLAWAIIFWAENEYRLAAALAAARRLGKGSGTDDNRNSHSAHRRRLVG